MKFVKALLVGSVFHQGIVCADVTLGRKELYAYYDKPSASSVVELRRNHGKVEVEICADNCDMFSAPLKEDEAADFWDSIYLFKAFVSSAENDGVFGRRNSALSISILERASKKLGCEISDNNRSLALCAIRKYAERSGFKYAQIVYDEGNQCIVYRRFDEKLTVLAQKCKRVGP